MVDDREVRQHRAVGPDQRQEAAGLTADPGVEILEIFGKHRGLDHAGKAAILVAAAPANAEEPRPLIGQPRRQHLADEGTDVALGMDPEVVPVREIDVGGRLDQAVDERPAVGIEYPERFHLGKRLGDPAQPVVQVLLLRDDLGIAHAADDLGDLGQAAVDGLEHLERVLMGDVERPLDLLVGGLAVRDPGHRRCEAEQRQRKGQRGGHHPLQQFQRIALCGLHGRSGSLRTLTQTVALEKPKPGSGGRRRCMAAGAAVHVSGRAGRTGRTPSVAITPPLTRRLQSSGKSTGMPIAGAVFRSSKTSHGQMLDPVTTC